MDDVFTYCVTLPPKVKGFTVPCADGYTIYVNERLDHAARVETYKHEIGHILNGDFEKDDARKLETEAHKRRYKDGTF